MSKWSIFGKWDELVTEAKDEEQTSDEYVEELIKARDPLPYPDAVPEDVKAAAKRVRSWMDSGIKCVDCGEVHRDGEFRAAHPYDPEMGITITQDQWEGLQFELSEIKGDINELQSYANGHAAYHYSDEPKKSAPQVASEKIEALIEQLYEPDEEPDEEPYDVGPRYLCGCLVSVGHNWGDDSGHSDELEDDDWGMDVDFAEREPKMVILAKGVPGLELGPFILVTPEERIAILNSLIELSREADELEARLTEAERMIDDMGDEAEPEYEYEQHVTGWPTITKPAQIVSPNVSQSTNTGSSSVTYSGNWTRLMTEGPDDDEPDAGVPAKV